MLWAATAPANGSTVLLPVLASSLGATADTGPIELTAAGLTILDDTVPADEIDASAVFDPFAPALSQGQSVELRPGARASIPVTVDEAELAEPDRARLAGGHPGRSGRAERGRPGTARPSGSDRRAGTAAVGTHPIGQPTCSADDAAAHQKIGATVRLGFAPESGQEVAAFQSLQHRVLAGDDGRGPRHVAEQCDLTEAVARHPSRSAAPRRARHPAVRTRSGRSGRPHRPR